MRRYSYPKMSKKLGSFELDVQSGEFTDSEIIVMLGENGTGKTTFIRLMAGHLAPDSDGNASIVLYYTFMYQLMLMMLLINSNRWDCINCIFANF